VTAITAPAPRVLVDSFVPTSVRWRAVALVSAAVALTALAAQVRFVLPWTPVPVTGQTFAVLLTSAALGMRLGAASQAVYVTIGAMGLPVFTNWQGGWTAATGVTAGYLVGFVIAAAVVGRLAERQQDRALITSLPAMLMGTAVIYLFGASWLAIHLDVPMAQAVELGVAPFLIGDTIKLAAAGALVPALWRLTGSDRQA
jgi:biotin transport system substrate-specific component